MAQKTKIEARFPGDLLERVDAFASRESMNRSEAVRELVTRGLHFGRRVLSRAETHKIFAEIRRQAFSPDSRL